VPTYRLPHPDCPTGSASYKLFPAMTDPLYRLESPENRREEGQALIVNIYDHSERLIELFQRDVHLGKGSHFDLSLW
jgi:hypothetical protein